MGVSKSQLPLTPTPTSCLHVSMGESEEEAAGLVSARLHPCLCLSFKEACGSPKFPILSSRPSPLPLKSMIYYQNSLYLNTFSENLFHHLALTEICLSREDIAILILHKWWLFYLNICKQLNELFFHSYIIPCKR